MKPRYFVVSLSLLVLPQYVAHAGPTEAGLPSHQSAASARQDRPLRVDERVVVTADREEDDVGNVGSSVSIISSEEIAASGARWLIDVLQFAPGVNVVRSGPAGTLTEVFVRGASSSQTLFLIDGVKANSPTSGSYDLANLQISADQIERIEIVRGPQSTLYGSQAIGGVINVITRRGRGAGTFGVEAEGGSFATGRLHSWLGGQSGSLGYAGSVSWLDAGGFSAASEANGNLEADGYRNVSYSGRIDYESSGGVRARGSLRGLDAEVLFDGFGADGPVDVLTNVQTTREIYSAGALGYGGERFSTEIEVSVSDGLQEAATPDEFFTAFLLDSAIYELDWQNGISLPADQELTAGIELRREQAEISSESPFGIDGFDEHVRHVGVYAQDRIAIGPAHLAAGFRYEDHSAFGDKWTGRFTGSVGLTGALRLHGSVGSGFKAPTLNDLYFPGFSNPDLLPEESVGVDFGAELADARRRVGVTYFRNDISNLIQFDLVAGIPMNVGEVLTHGIEVDGGSRLAPEFEGSGNYTYTSARPEGSDEQLIRRPRHQGSIRLTWLPTSALRTWGEVRFEAGRFDSGANGRVAMDPFAIVNLASDYRLSSLLLLHGRIENLFDTEYEEIEGFGTAGLSGYFGLTVTLSRD